MRIIITTFLLLISSIYLMAQTPNAQSNNKGTIVLFVIELNGNKEVATPDLILLSSEVETFTSVPRPDFLKSDYRKKYGENTSAFKVIAKPNVNFIRLKEILTKYNIKNKNLPVKINGLDPRGDYKYIYVSENAIESVKIANDGKSISITTKQEVIKR